MTHYSHRDVPPCRLRPGRAWLAAGLSLAVAAGHAAPSPYLPFRPEVRIELGSTHLAAEGSLAAPVSRKVAWAVLSDHDHFADFVPGLHANRVVEDRNHDKIVAQRGEITTAGPRLRYDGTLRIREQPGEGMRLLFLSGLFKDSEGEWRLSGERPVTLVYRLRMDLRKSPLPPPMAATVVEQQVRQWLSAVAAEMERRQALAPDRP